MMQTMRFLLGFGVVLVAFVAVLAVLWFILMNAWMFLSSLPKEVAPAWVTGFATFSGAVLGILISKVFERRNIVEQELRQKKSVVYQRFVEFLVDIMVSEKLTEARS